MEFDSFRNLLQPPFEQQDQLDQERNSYCYLLTYALSQVLIFDPQT